MRMRIGGPSGPLIIAINSIINFQLIARIYYIDKKECELMNLLTISGIRESLEYVRDHADVKYHTSGSRKGMIVTPSDFTPEQGYSLFLVQKFTPKLTAQLLENVSALTLEGQELLDILSDEAYIDKISTDLKRIGYTNPSDRQIFREIRRRMEIVDFSLTSSTDETKELLQEFFKIAQEISIPSINALSSIVTDETVKSISETKESETEETKLALTVEVPEKIDADESLNVTEKVGVGSSLVSNSPTITVQGSRSEKQRKGKN